MKPVERSGYVDFWILMAQSSTGQFVMLTTQIKELGAGIFTSEKEAQHQQTVERLKGNNCEVFHLEWPL